MISLPEDSEEQIMDSEDKKSVLDEKDLTPQQPEEPEKSPAVQKERPGYEAFAMLQDLVTILAIITIVFVFFFRLVGVDGSSMFPTFYNRDYLVLESNFLYRTVEAGDIVVVNVPAYADKGPLVKRVVATGGQTVDIDFDAGVVYVDGKALDEPYIAEPTHESFEEYGESLTYPLTVPDGCVFVMGDNRNNSMDSRFSPIGCVDLDCVLGKAIFVIFPGQQTDNGGNITGSRDFGRIGAVS
jgi:signal peptidase I